MALKFRRTPKPDGNEPRENVPDPNLPQGPAGRKVEDGPQQFKAAPKDGELTLMGKDTGIAGTDKGEKKVTKEEKDALVAAYFEKAGIDPKTVGNALTPQEIADRKKKLLEVSPQAREIEQKAEDGATGNLDMAVREAEEKAGINAASIVKPADPKRPAAGAIRTDDRAKQFTDDRKRQQAILRLREEVKSRDSEKRVMDAVNRVDGDALASQVQITSPMSDGAEKPGKKPQAEIGEEKTLEAKAAEREREKTELVDEDVVRGRKKVTKIEDAAAEAAEYLKGLGGDSALDDLTRQMIEKKKESQEKS